MDYKGKASKFSSSLNRPFILVLSLSLLVLLFFPSAQVLAAGETAVYTAPGGFRVISYSWQWADADKLKGVYEELLRNTHGEEFKLLTRINIYPGPDPQGMSAAGRWYGVWSIKDGMLQLAGNRHIDIYNGDDLTGIEDLARTISHEYGHHFTYYYFFKKERKQWDQWKNSTWASVRGLKNHPLAGPAAADHKWMIQEIAAEDYVQFFGSPTAKKSRDFADIAERLRTGQTRVVYNTDQYNFRPQENYELPLASNLPGIRDYWLNASGIKDTAGKAPVQVSPELKSVNIIDGVSTPQYVFSWGRSSDDKTPVLEYTLVSFERTSSYTEKYFPVKTVTDDEPLEAVVGSASDSRMYMWEDVPGGVAYYVVYIKDSDGLVTSSQILAVDFTDRRRPKTVLIDDNSRTNGFWFPPRVKIDSRQMSFDVPPVIQNGRTLVPLRAIFEELGAQVDWDEQSQTVTGRKRDTVLQLTIGSSTALVNGEQFILEAPPVIINSRTLVPIRFVSEALGADVDWNKNLQLVTITPDPGGFSITWESFHKFFTNCTYLYHKGWVYLVYQEKEVKT